MTAAGAATPAVIVPTGRFSRPALAFAVGEPLRLVDGEALASFVALVQVADRSGIESAGVATTR